MNNVTCCKHAKVDIEKVAWPICYASRLKFLSLFYQSSAHSSQRQTGIFYSQGPVQVSLANVLT